MLQDGFCNFFAGHVGLTTGSQLAIAWGNSNVCNSLDRITVSRFNSHGYLGSWGVGKVAQ